MRIKKKRWYSLGTIPLVLLASSCSFGGSQSPNETITLKFMTNGLESYSEAIISAFEAKYPNYQIEEVNCGCGPEENLRQAMEYARNGEIDIVALAAEEETIANWIDSDLLTDLFPYVERHRNDFSFMSQTLQDMTRDNKLYSLPFAIETPLFIVINEDLFQANDVEVPKEGWTWEDFGQIAARLAAPDGSISGFASTMIEQLPIVYLTQKHQGYSWIHDSSALEEASDYFRRMILEDRSLLPAPGKQFNGRYITGGEAINDFDIGKSAMTLHPISSIPYLSNQWNFKWSVVPIPLQPDSEVKFPSQIRSLGIAANSNKADAAWELLKFVSTAGGEELAQSGLMPVNLTSAAKDNWSKSYPFLKHKEVFPQSRDIFHSIPVDDFSSALRAFNEVLSDKQTVQDAIARHMSYLNERQQAESGGS